MISNHVKKKQCLFTVNIQFVSFCAMMMLGGVVRVGGCQLSAAFFPLWVP